MTLCITNIRRNSPKLVVVMGVPIDNLDMGEVAEKIERFIRSGQSHWVATANVNFLVKSHQDPEVLEVLRRADVITPDGMPVLWAARLLGARLKERVTGADLTPYLIRLAARKGYRLFFLGGKPGVGEAAVARLKKEYPGLKAFCHSPNFDPLLRMDNDKILDEIKAVRPDVLFVSLGAGKTEKWLRMNLHRLEVPVSVGVGATIDLLAGRAVRAPLWMQKAGLEWFFRLIREPGRLWPRYLGDFWYFTFYFLRHWFFYLRQQAAAMRTPAGRMEVTAPSGAEGGAAGRVIKITGGLDRELAGRVTARGESVLESSRPLIIDLSGVKFIDGHGLGCLIGLERWARAKNSRLYLTALPPQVKRDLKAARADWFFRIQPSPEAAMKSLREEPPWPLIKNKKVLGGRKLVVALRGSFDADCSRQFKEALSGFLDQEQGLTELELDMAEVGFMDSSGLGVLIALYRRLTAEEKRLSIKNVSGRTARVFKLTRMDRLLNIETAG